MRIIVALLGLIISTSVFAQSKFDGSWYFESAKAGLYCVIKDGELTHYVWDAGLSKWIEKSASLGPQYQFVSGYKENKNNAIYYWMNTCATCEWTETQIFNIFYISKHVMYVKFERHVNGIDEAGANENCWTGGKCGTTTTEGWMAHATHQRYTNLTFNASSVTNFKPIEVRQTENTTHVKVRLTSDRDNFNCTLYAPMDDRAFFIRDVQGKTYKLVGQYGFGGKGYEDGFGSITLKYDEDVMEFTLIFEKLPSSVSTFSLIEGNCGSKCWNVYDIKLQ